MAVVNSVNQIVVPGIEQTLQTNVDIAITNNDTIDAINTNLQVSGTIEDLNDAISSLNSQIANLPTPDPLPNFATYSNRDNQPYWHVYDSDMQFMEAGYQHTDAELYSPWTGNNYTNGNFGSNAWTSNWMGATPMQQADGHIHFNLNSGHATYAAKNPDNLDYWTSRWGVVVNRRGFRQPISLFIDGSDMRIMARGIGEGYYELINLNNNTYATWNTNSGWGCVGSIGYNDRTRTLVVVQATSTNNNYRMHVWRNTGNDRSLTAKNYNVGTLHLFLSEAKAGFGLSGEASYNFYDFQWQANSSQSYNESRYRLRVIPGDNGVVGMARMVPSNVTHYATYQPSTQTLLTSYNTIGLTTSYGYEQGNKYGMRHAITWDNYWVAAYSAYYYYGAGINVFFIDTRDPRNYFTGQNADTNNGCQLVPFAENQFMFNRSVENADGNVGMRLYIVDPEGALGGRVTGGTITNGASINLTANQQSGIFDTWSTTTNYPVLMPMPRWRKNV